MALQRSTVAFQTIRNLRKIDGEIKLHLRSRTTTPSGAILPEPKKTRFGFLGVICSVMTGLVIGTTLSKMMANFLEEKELFVPSDDDDDDD
ncbi:essential MCU regulator, mitochondrial [Apis laboriosa]|uniref:essential MCU regulator, mitochondrial n=1 Tax=Apis dorsata TaxID=7462 RepID=UPI0003DF56CA|nr:essential MCU regulator, mitochondrial [Apis dorsata]XP_031369391.1 essential MCU regulator, mitochondrial [Apis dorsata]XP_043792138.1 essential MCU regulator, mitochondrial [Apis laboriosa]